MFRFKIHFYLLLALLLFLISACEVKAVTLSYSNVPSTINSDPFTISVTVDGASTGINYLRVDLFKENTSNYFGETYNGSSWYGGSEGIHYYPVTIDDTRIATASVQARVGHLSLGDYPGPGHYKLRVRRYTNSGNAAGSDELSPVSVEITIPAASPEPTPEATPKSSPVPSATLKATIIPSMSLRPKIRVTPVSSPSPDVESSPVVLGEIRPVTSPRASPYASPQPKRSIALPAGIIMMIGGIGLSGCAGFLAYKKSQTKD